MRIAEGGNKQEGRVMLMENGTYGAVVRDVHLYERGEQKRLSAAFRLDVGGTELVHREWLELNDGTLSERTLQRLRKVFPKWDGTIEKLDEGFCCQDVEVEIVVENEPDQQDPGKLWTRTKFMNPRVMTRLLVLAPPGKKLTPSNTAFEVVMIGVTAVAQNMRSSAGARSSWV